MSNLAWQPPPGMVSDDTVFASPGRWRRGSWVRFWEGNWQIKGGWERLLLDNLGGVCRCVFAWQDGDEVLSVAFGLHNALKYWQSGTFADITPQYTVSGNSPVLSISTFNGSPEVVVNEPGHGRSVGQLVTISGAPNPLGGLNPNGTFAISSVNPGAWGYIVGPPATATANSGPAVIVLVANIPPGQIDGTGGAGYGTGAYGVGAYGEPSTDDYFPRTWALAAFGGDLMANPRGGTIYRYTTGDARAVALVGAPAEVAFMLTTASRQVMAFGCNEEVSGDYNPLAIRFSDIEDANDWASLPSNNAGEVILESGGRIVCARTVGDYVLVWTTVSLFLGTFLGDPGQTWKFERVGANCGSISPGAPIIKSQTATWISVDRQIWSYSLGAAPVILECPIRAMFHDNVSQGQDDKIVGSSVSKFAELTWFYPDARDGLENSRAITMAGDGWHPDLIARSAYCDAGPATTPIGVSPGGFAYWHEKGHSADGAVLQGFIESTDFYLGTAEGGVMLNGIWPDFKDQVGNLTLRIFGRERPQSTEREFGPWNLGPNMPKKSFRLTSRIVRLRYDFASAPAYARGGKPLLDMQSIGGR